MDSQMPISEQIKQLEEQVEELTTSIEYNQQLIMEMEIVDKLINHMSSTFEAKVNSTKSDVLQKNSVRIQQDIKTIQNLPRNFSFSIKQHIAQCLDVSKVKNIKIKISQSKLELSRLYSKIQKYLEEEQPYIYDKVFAKIKTQVEGYGRAKLLKNIRKQYEQLNDWKEKNIDQAVKQSNLDQMGVSVAQNATMLTQIRNRKVLANDIIFSEITHLEKAKAKVKQIPDYIQKLKAQFKQKMSRNI